MKTANISVIILILVSFTIGIYSYQAIEGNIVASHWGAEGKVDDYMSKFWGIFLFPIIISGLYLLFLIIPIIDPLSKNIERFRTYYDIFVLVLMIFFFYVYILTILANLNYSFNMTQMMIPAIGVLFFYIGIIMKKLRRNWYIGIRTPWTLSSDKVWDKTHNLGSILFRIEGIIILFGIFFPSSFLIQIILLPIFVIIIWLVVYSYLEFKKLKKNM